MGGGVSCHRAFPVECFYVEFDLSFLVFLRISYFRPVGSFGDAYLFMISQRSSRDLYVCSTASAISKRRFI